MENLSQRDTRWKDIKIGNSSSSIGAYGCTLTALAILAGTTPDVVNAYLSAVNGFLVDRIIWTKLNETKLGLSFPDNGRQYSYNDEAVRKAIELYKGCLVEVDFDGVIATPNDRHWVLFIGDHKLIDPWDGKIKDTSSYPLLKGYAIIQANHEKDNELTPEEERILAFLKERNANEGVVREALDSLTEKALLKVQIQTLNEEISSLKSSHENLQKQIDELGLKLAEEQKSQADWQSQVEFANKQLENELEQNAILDEERKKYKRLYETSLDRGIAKATTKELFSYLFKRLLGK